jgi:hypothetical protein
MVYTKPDERVLNPKGRCLKQYGSICELWLLDTEFVLVRFPCRSSASITLGRAELARGKRARRELEKTPPVYSIYVPLIYWHWGHHDKSLWLYYTKNILQTLQSTRQRFTRNQRYMLMSSVIGILQKEYETAAPTQSLTSISLEAFSFYEKRASKRYYLALSFRAFVPNNVATHYPCDLVRDPMNWTPCLPLPVHWCRFQLGLLVLQFIGKFDHQIGTPYHDIQPEFRRFTDAIRSGDIFSFLPVDVQHRIHRLLPWFVVALSSWMDDKGCTPNPYTFLHRFFVELTCRDLCPGSLPAT